MIQDITGAPIKKDSWVAYATSSGDLKFGRVVESRSIYGNLAIENTNILGKRYRTELFPLCAIVIPECRVPNEVKTRILGKNYNKRK
jgi:hypothetical protein